MNSPHAPRMTPSAYEVDGRDASARAFIDSACDPQRSVVVEACAGSGKTWLLVARMLRLLLAGAQPSELLAITFTRKAAQEMRERLLQLLHELALGTDAQVLTILQERGISPAEAQGLLPMARGLYERVLSSPQSLSIDTFHSWFARLVQIAPLASGVPHGYMLTESSGELMTEATNTFMQSLNDAGNADARAALLALYDMVGDSSAAKLLNAFIAKRAEWWASTAQQGAEADMPAPLAWLHELCGEDGLCDARLSVWEDEALVARLLAMAQLLGQGAKTNQDRAVEIESAITEALESEPALAHFSRLLTQFCDDKGKPRGNNHRRGQMQKAVDAAMGEGAADMFEEEFNALGAALLQRQRRSFEPGVLAMNAALFTAGAALLAHYQAAKAARRVFDFADLEWHAYRLLTNEEHAAYLQSRLDARYKHILLDEFQDTNPLQWNIVLAWLNAYGEDASQPSVFIVGDPKQSIYRFRRAEPRVFRAAWDLLLEKGAATLRTNQTRRNAGAIVEVLNHSFLHNPIFAPQTTLSEQAGEVWRLPLVRKAQADKSEPAAESPTFTLRNPLTCAREEEEDARRRDEGSLVAQALLQARQNLSAEQQLPWSDVMLLVKKRAHLGAYESALREAGIPFVSDKRGGLLESLEVADLIALLTFLITPGDDRSLAQVLKSPVMGASDQDLIALARRSEKTWWQRLRHLAHQGAGSVSAGNAAVCPAALARAATLLQKWLADAPRLPVHDLLDVILHEGQLLARYAQAASPATRSQVIGNIETFTELSLDLDAGRYPSLPKFIQALRVLQNGADNEAPDEANIDAAVDAVRILTIHSAKGLEASVVVVLDANHSEPARDDAGILCDWPQDRQAPTHFSVFGRKDERGAARDPLFAEEEQFKQQEDWNLLYVAMTRAKRLLIVSGVAGARNADAHGVVTQSWYARLLAVPETELVAPVADGGNGASPQLHDLPTFSLTIFDPPQLPAAAQTGIETGARESSSAEIDEGIALHALMERVTATHDWPIILPDSATIERWLACGNALAAVIRDQAATLLAQPQLARFFDPAQYQFARNEMEVVCDAQILRFDRVVSFGQEIWILDYKRQVLPSEQAAYQAQMHGYRCAAQAVFKDKSVRTALLSVDGRLWEIT